MGWTGRKIRQNLDQMCRRFTVSATVRGWKNDLKDLKDVDLVFSPSRLAFRRTRS